MGVLPPLLLLSCLLASLAVPAVGLDYDMVFQTKCLLEEISSGVLAVGDFRVFNKRDPKQLIAVDVRVEDPKGRTIHTKKLATDGQFAFTANDAGDYRACFVARDVHQAQEAKIRLDWKTGVAATDWDAIAKKEQLSDLALDLRKLEETVRLVHNLFKDLVKVEEQMRDLNEKTNERVAFYSFLSLAICIGLGIAQLVYLRGFFIRKKVI